MRILQVAPFFSPQMGGSAQMVFQTANHLAKRGHQVSVLAGDYGTKVASFPTDKGFDQILLPSLISKWGLYVTPKLLDWARKNLERYDVIHMHELRTFQNIVVGQSAIPCGKSYMISAHGSLPVMNQRKLAKRIFDQCFRDWLLSKASFLIAVSETEAQQYISLCPRKDRIRLVYNGLEINEYSQRPIRGLFRSKIGLQDRSIKIVLYVGRLHRLKGLRHLIKAFASLTATDEQTLLVIVGPDEGEMIHLRNLISQLKLDEKVIFAGPLYGRTKMEAMVDADVLAYPSQYEIFGLVPFEALMCGTPVVVDSGTGLGELIRRAGAGYLVSVQDPEDLKEGLARALSNREEAQRLVKAGQAFVKERLDWNKIVLELEDIYYEALNGWGKEY